MQFVSRMCGVAFNVCQDLKRDFKGIIQYNKLFVVLFTVLFFGRVK